VHFPGPLPRMPEMSMALNLLEFYVVRKLLASAKMEGNRVTRRWCGQHNA
jgi:hypothetical protein